MISPTSSASSAKKEELDVVGQELLNELLKMRVDKSESTSKVIDLPVEKLFNKTEKEELGDWTYYKLFGEPASKLPDFNIKVYKDTDWSIEWQTHIPDATKFQHYVKDHTVLYPLMLGIQHNMNTLLTGPTGCGKSSVVEYVCSVIRQPFFRLNGRQDMESDTILGKVWVAGGEMKYILGDFSKARRDGCMILWDEVWKVPSGIQMALQRMYEREGVLQLDDMPGTLEEKQIKPDPRGRLILADNVVGVGDGLDKYAATLIQDASTLNRMEMVLTCDYLKPDDEIGMLEAIHEHLPKTQARKMVQLAGLIRTGFSKGELSSTMSPRQLNTWAKLALAVGEYKTAFNYVMKGRLATTEEQASLLQLWNTVYKV